MTQYLQLVFLCTLLISTEAFDCSSVSTSSQCDDLGPSCNWVSGACSGNYVSTCTSCYYVDPIGGSDSANGASLTPYQTLSPALEALSSSSGTIIVFNPITNIEAKILRYKEINSQITIK